MDFILRTRIELDAIRTEHLRRSPKTPRTDLLERLDTLRIESIQQGIPEFTAVALLITTDILLDTGYPTEALESLSQAKVVLSGHNDHSRDTDLLVYQARGHALLEQWPEASDVCEEGINIIETFRRKVTPLGLQSAYLRFKIELYEIGVRAAYELGKPELALNRAELAKCATARRFQNRASCVQKSDDVRRDEYRSVCEQLDRPDLTAAARSQLEAKRRALWDFIAIRRFRSEDDPFEVSHTQLAHDEALIYYFWINELELMIFGLTNSGIAAELHHLSTEDRALIERIPQAIMDYHHPANGKLITPNRKHSSLLLPQGILEVSNSRKRCLISPHRALHMLPFHALPIENEYFIDKHPITYVPNLHAAVARHEQIPVRSLCAIGVAKTRVTGANGKQIREIPNAQTEVESIVQVYAEKGISTTSLLAREATCDVIRKLDLSGELRHYSHLHLVCHGETVDSDSPLESKLILEDAVLDGLDISEFKINAEVTMLSACCSGQRPFHMPVVSETSRRVELPGDELFGLQAAFFAAGACQLVATLWPIDSDPALNISTAFHKYLIAGLQTDEALQQAMVNYRNRPGLRNRKVDMWAPFFLTALSRPSNLTKTGVEP